MSKPTFDAEAWLDTAGPALGVPVSEAQRPGVVLNLAIAAEMATQLFTVPLEDTIDLAPVFEPRKPAGDD